MPVTPAPPDRILREFVAVHRAAELRLTEALAKATARGVRAIGEADELRTQLTEATRLRRETERILYELQRTVATAIPAALAEAAIAGGRAAIADLDRVLGPAGRDYTSPLNQGALAALARSMSDQLTPAYRSVTRAVDDVYRQVIGRSSVSTLVGTETRREASQRALDEFAARGVAGFTDRRGRRWAMDTYAEMAMRTATARATVDAHVDRLAAEDLDLVYVSDSPQECPLCRPWEHKVLITSDTSGPRTVEVEHPLYDDQIVRVQVAGSLDWARAAGLFHPNCTHSVSLYLPGVTKLRETQAETANAEGYEDKQHLRYLERGVRRAKRVEAAAMSPAARRRASARVRAWEDRIRDHVGSSQAKRQPARESNMYGRPDQAQPVDGDVPVFVPVEDVRPRPPEPAALPSAERPQLEAPPAQPRPRPPRPAPASATEALNNQLHALRPVRRTQRLRELDDDQLQQVIAEEERRALLLGYGDRASKVKKAAAAEVARRAKPKPLRQLTIDELADAMNAALADGDMDAFDRYANEEDRRARERDRRAEAAAARREEREREQAEMFEEMLAQGVDPEEADAIAAGTTVEAARRREVMAQLRRDGYRGSSFDQLARQAFRDEVMRRYLAAQDATNGYMTTREATAAGIDPLTLFTGPEARARKHASDELAEWWDQHGRLTFDEYRAELLGDSAGARQMRAERGDFYT